MERKTAIISFILLIFHLKTAIGIEGKFSYHMYLDESERVHTSAINVVFSLHVILIMYCRHMPSQL